LTTFLSFPGLGSEPGIFFIYSLSSRLALTLSYSGSPTFAVGLTTLLKKNRILY
jgi:hypothetical protein